MASSEELCAGAEAALESVLNETEGTMTLRESIDIATAMGVLALVQEVREMRETLQHAGRLFGADE